MKTKSFLAGVMFLLLPCVAHAWTGETWGSITRSTIQSIADQMINSTWTPNNTFNNYEYTDDYGVVVRYTYTKGVNYTGIPYGQAPIQDNWQEFSGYMLTTSGGNKNYGNDCSGFVSICWKLPARKNTTDFENGINGTYWSSLGNIGSASSVSLLLGDALNYSGNHMLMFLNYESSGLKSMEQTPHRAQRRVWSYSSLAAYRPIRRNQITGGGQPDLTIFGPVVVSPTSVAPGGTIRVDWTEKNQGTTASSPAHNTKIFLSSSAYGTTYQVGYYGPMNTLGVGATHPSGGPSIVVPASIPAGDYYVTAFIDCDLQVSEANDNNNIGSSSPTRLTVGITASRIISLSGNLAFGNVPVGSSAQSTLTIANNGSSTMTVNSISYPSGFSGNWSGAITAGNSRNVTVTFSPSAATTYSGNLAVNSDATSGTSIRAVSGTGTASPTRIISLSGSLAFGDVTVGSSLQRTLTIANSGNSTLTVSTISYPSGFSGNWSGTITAGNSRNVTVTFSPGTATTYSGNLAVNSDATSGTSTRAVSGTGTASPTRIISLSGNLAFGNVPVGSSAQSTVTIANNGSSTMTVSSISYPSGFSGNWSGAITAGNSQNVTVTFSPSAATSYGGTATVNSDKTSGVNTIAASGTGTATLLPDLTIVEPVVVSPASVAPGGTIRVDWTEKNQGTGASTPAHNTKIFLSSSAYGTTHEIAYYGPMNTLGVGATQLYSVPNIVVPASIPAGDYYVTAFIDCDLQDSEGNDNNNIGSSSPTRLTVGITASRIISLSGNLAFGNVPLGSSAQSTLTIANNGNSSMTVSSISYPSGFSGTWSGTIAAGSSQPVTVTFSPSSATSYGGTVTVNANQTSGVNTIAASGSGTVTPTRIISLGGNLAFSSVTVGSSAQSTLTIYNNGNSTMTVSSLSDPSGFSGSWSGTITAGSSQPVTVTFSPSSATGYGGTVTVNANQTSGVNTIAASGSGTVTPTRIISLGGNLAFSSVTVGSSAQSTLTIYNNGNSTMTVSSLSYPSGFSGNWSGTIAAGSSQPVTMTFSPASATSYGGTVTVNSDKTSGANTIAASGTGTITPTRIISLSGNLAFGNVTVGSSAQSTLTIANNGSSTLTVSSLSYPSGFSGNWSSGTIPASGSQNVTVTCSPTAAASYAGTVTVNSDKTSGANTIAASGTGIVLPPICSATLLSPATGASVSAPPAFTWLFNGSCGTKIYITTNPVPELIVVLSNVFSSGMNTFTASESKWNTVLSRFGGPQPQYYWTVGDADIQQADPPMYAPWRPFSVLWKQLTGMTISNGVFCFALNGPVGSTHIIQVSSNLVNWLPLVTNVIPASGSILITDPVIGPAMRFYRAVEGNTSVAPTNMALIPAGSFTMGDTFSEGDSDELPLHSVYVSSFYMDQYAVTKALWDEVYNWAITHGYSFDNGGGGKAATHPVQTISWDDAVKWCNARSEKEGRVPAYYSDAGLTVRYRTGQVAPFVNWSSGYRLPTEAEREKAARGGASGHRFPWTDTDDITHSMANYLSASQLAYDTSTTRGYHPTFNDGVLPYTSPVGYFAANGYGLYDMVGNVWEWCWDWYLSTYYSSSPGSDPRGAESGSYRVLRGGRWGGFAYDCWVAHRGAGYTAYTGLAVGFRCVLPPGL